MCVCDTMEPDREDKPENERPLLVLENPKKKSSLLVTDESQVPFNKAASYPFKKWMDSFRVKRHQTLPLSERFVEGWFDQSQADNNSNNNLFPNHAVQDQQWERLSGHSSQLGTVKTATMSIASQSVVRSRGNTQSTTNQSAGTDTRMSMDSMRTTLSPPLDEAAQSRALKRRQVLQEIVTTESDYVLGLKALSDVLSIFSTTRPEIYFNIQQIREIHGRFLTLLQNVTPRSVELIGIDLSSVTTHGLQRRLGTIDLSSIKVLHSRSLRTRSLRASVSSRMKALSAEPYEALEVAREIEKLSTFFPVYEEFCSKYELLTQDLAILRRSIPNWAMFDQGIEALSKSVASIDSRKLEGNRAMSLSDLLIKPIQRLCKYPLLLQDLLRCTAASDCPSSHEGIREIFENMRDSVARINAATGNPVHKDRIMKTVLLQEKLEFREPGPFQNIYRQLGPMCLCGVLHVAYQSSEAVQGEYMVCVLFSSHFLLARIDEDYRKLQAVACLYVCDMKIDALSTGREAFSGKQCYCNTHSGIGLYCRGALFSWKISFENGEDMFELILSASSAREEKQWKTEIIKSAAALAEAGQTVPSEPRTYSFLSLNLVPLNDRPDQATSLTRTPSIHSLAVSRSKSSAREVYIKKTNYPNNTEETGLQPEDGHLGRTKSVHSKREPIVLAPRRQDRIRLERFVADVYTRDVLPFPGMVLAKGDIFSRTGSLIRRISSHAGFNRRSSSLSTTYARSIVADTGSIEEEHPIAKDEASDNSKRGGPPTESQLDPARNTVPELPRETPGHAKATGLKGSCRHASGTDLAAAGNNYNGDLEPTSKKKRNLLRTVLFPRNVRKPGFKKDST